MPPRSFILPVSAVAWSCWSLVPAPFFIVGLGAERLARSECCGKRCRYDDYIKR